MDLLKAQKEAALKSKGRKTIYLNVDSEGEVFVSSKPIAGQLYTTFQNGKEVANPAGIETLNKVTTKTKPNGKASKN